MSETHTSQKALTPKTSTGKERFQRNWDRKKQIAETNPNAIVIDPKSEITTLFANPLRTYDAVDSIIRINFGLHGLKADVVGKATEKFQELADELDKASLEMITHIAESKLPIGKVRDKYLREQIIAIRGKNNKAVPNPETATEGEPKGATKK